MTNILVKKVERKFNRRNLEKTLALPVI